MRFVFYLLQAHASRLDRRTRRLLVFISALGLALYARATVEAAGRAAIPELLAGLCLLGGFVVLAALVWSVPRTPRR
jgi:hypothetical protein